MKRFLKQTVTIICSFFAVVYTIMQLSLTADTSISTEHAFFSVVDDTIVANAYIFRDETVVTQSGGGTRSYSAFNGEKVRINSELCVTYQEADEAVIQENINDINKQIELLKKSNIETGSYSTDLARVNGSISEYMMQMQRSVASGDLSAAARIKDDLLLQMNRRLAIVSDDKNYYGSRIGMLETQRNELQAQLSGVKVTTVSPAAGYFYIGADGYETSFSASALDSIDVKGFKQLIKQKPSESLLSEAVGKIARSSKWYIAFVGTRRDSAYFEEGSKVKVQFPYNDNCEIDMIFERVMGDTKSDEVVFVFSTGALPTDFNFSRMQEVRIIKNTNQGLKIRTTALRNENGESGVYVLSAGRIIFKTAKVLCETGGFYIVELPNPKDLSQRSNTKLSLHDTVITGGKNLYVGKVL